MSQRIEDRIEEIKAELAKMQYNKATQGHFATLKARMAQLQSELVDRAQASKAKKGAGFSIRKHGDATAILLGFPSVGKSTLLNAITNKESKVGAYDFTTLDAIPGMMEYDGKYKGTQVQILDLPGIIQGGAKGKGRGREIFAAVRNADIIIIMIDGANPDHLPTILEELYDANIRLDQRPPRMSVKKQNKGGIHVTGFRTDASEEEIANVLRTYRVMNANVFLSERDITIDQIIDHVAGNRMYVPSLVVVNKVDLLSKRDLTTLRERIGRDFVPISAELGQGLQELKEAVVETIGLMRIYLRQPGKKADLEEPMIVKRGLTVEDLCRKIHKRFVDDFRFANVWGPSAKFPGQKVGLSHELEDSDIIKIILYK